MACVSELAYVRFNPLIPNDKLQDIFNEKMEELLKSKKKSLFTSLLSSFAYDHEKEKDILESDLKTLHLKLTHTFDIEDTQAIIVVSEHFTVLAFRGTEANKPKDIKSDIGASIVRCNSGGMIHKGFSQAYNLVSTQLQSALAAPEIASKPLFITGHSLGGALATIAAKRLTHNAGIAACYTFGSPRVGDSNWVSGIRAPLYRVVNAADAVTMLPPGGAPIALLSKFISVIPYLRAFGEMLQKKFGGYLHSGDMRYLTNCENGDFEQVKLLTSVTWLYRVMGVIKNNVSASKPLKDHSMINYRTKLAIIARRRNLE